MKVKCYSHIGKKKANEDSILCANNCLIVCDGVGGAVKGELASKQTAAYISTYIENGKINEERIYRAIMKSQDNLNDIVEKENDLDGMATTLAACFFSNTNQLFVAHMGDSRVYIIRPSKKIFWHTWDHSFVSSLVKSGEITREVARRHPMNNQITKALKGSLNRKTHKPDIQIINDLELGDILFVCSDGISEAFSDLELLNILSYENNSLEEKLKIIEDRCSQQSYDNNSAIICQLEEHDIPVSAKDMLSWQEIDSLIDSKDLDEVNIE